MVEAGRPDTAPTYLSQKSSGLKSLSNTLSLLHQDRIRLQSRCKVQTESLLCVLPDLPTSENSPVRAEAVSTPSLQKHFGDVLDVKAFNVKNALTRRYYKMGDYIIREGEAGYEFFIIQKGECVASKQNEGQVAYYVAGGSFGERALLRSEPRAASVIAISDVEVLVFTSETFREIIHKRDLREECLRNAKLLELMSDQQIAKVAAAMVEKRFGVGDVIIQQDDEGDEIFVVESGTCAAQVRIGNSMQEVMRYNSGELFGELALLNRTTRAATVIACTNVEVLVLSRGQFETLIGPLSQLRKEQYLADPRKLMSNFFSPGDTRGPLGSLLRRNFEVVGPHQSSWFAVFRPTSSDSIAKMLGKVGVGKGLNVKGKSAKRNRLSGFVPFVQISNNWHKKQLEETPKRARLKIFYQSAEARTKALAILHSAMLEPSVLRRIKDPHIDLIDSYAPDAFGLDMPEAVLCEVYIMRPDLTPMVGWETGRASEPMFMDMNLHACRTSSDPPVVVYQHDHADPMNPLGLLIAYAETSVKPVVSDFDGFLIGSRGIEYGALPPEQLKLAAWCLEHAKTVLGQPGSSSWTNKWLQILKKEAESGFYPKIPRFGLGDPTSYELTADLVDATSFCGAVRHGAECFNFYFPQELDDEYLVVWEGFSEPPWVYVTEPQLRQFLLERVAEGFTFPLNPVWPVRDPEWYEVLQALRQSPFAQQSLSCWFPQAILQTIDCIHQEHPDGFYVENMRQGSLNKNARSRTINMAALDLQGNDLMYFAEGQIRKVMKKRWARICQAIIQFAELQRVTQDI